MPQERKVIVTCAITGAIHTPSMSAYLPITPEEIAQAAVEAADAGAAIVHLHARDPETGKPDQRPEAFKKLRQMVAGGDVLSPAHVSRALRAMDDGVCINGYGPTENTTFTTRELIRRSR